MHLRHPILLFSLLLALIATPAVADDFSLVVSDVNTFFSLHRDDFRLQVSAEFGVPAARVDRLVASTGSAGDAYLCLQASRSSGRSLDEVTRVWQRTHKRGWGAVAQELGIKPGSDEFKRLKRHQLQKKEQENQPYKRNKEKGKGKKKD